MTIGYFPECPEAFKRSFADFIKSMPASDGWALITECCIVDDSVGRTIDHLNQSTVYFGMRHDGFWKRLCFC